MADTWRPDPALGVFETLLMVDGQPVEWEAHVARLKASLGALFPSHDHADLPLDVPVERGPYGPLSTGTSGRDGARALRITVAPVDGGGLGARVEVRAAECRTHPVALRSLPLGGGLGAHKWADRSLLEEAEARPPAGSLPLIVDADGTVLEASRANVFAVRDGTLLTPPADGRLLPGITRMRTIEVAAAAGVDTHESELCGADLISADEVFLTGSVRGVEWAGALDGVELAGPGEVGALIAAELRQQWNNVPVG